MQAQNQIARKNEQKPLVTQQTKKTNTGEIWKSEEQNRTDPELPKRIVTRNSSNRENHKENKIKN